MGTMGVIGMKGYMTALVSDEVFVVGGQQDDCAAAESSGAAVLVEEEGEAFPALFDEFRPDGIHACFAVAYIESAPPHEVL